MKGPHTEETKRKISEKKKGSIPWNLGVSHTPEVCKKMSEIRKAKGTSPAQLEHLRKMSDSNKGRKLTVEQIENLRKINTGRVFSEDRRRNMSNALKGRPSHMKGKHLSLETKNKLRVANLGKVGANRGRKMPLLSGANHWNWKGGINPINDTIRKSLEYKLWRKAVFERDSFTCVLGGKEHGNKLQADHIKPFSLFPELRFAIDNGRTLCADCHRKTDTYAGRMLKSTMVILQSNIY